MEWEIEYCMGMPYPIVRSRMGVGLSPRLDMEYYRASHGVVNIRLHGGAANLPYPLFAVDKSYGLVYIDSYDSFLEKEKEFIWSKMI